MKPARNSEKPRRPTRALISQALRAAAQDAVELHRRAGLPLAVWRDGQVALVPADKIFPKPNGRPPRRRKPPRKRRA
jgi:hypothetical protein